MPLAQIFADDIRALRRGPSGPALGAERARVFRFGDRAARSTAPVLIESEAGSGAQALARAIHDCGERRSRPFVRLNPDDLRGADADPKAIIARHLQEASGGTLFIPEACRLPLPAQDQLFDMLSRLESLTRGARRSARPDARIIAATDHELAGKVREGRFREDLYYRLQVLPVSLRPLRAQGEAIAEWAHVLMHRFAAEEGKRVKGISPEAAALLARYDWPGNLRQLANAVFRAVVLADGPLLTPAEFPQIAAHVRGFRIEIPPLPAPTPLAPAQDALLTEGRDPHALRLVNESGEMRTLAELEAQAIRFALAHYQGHLSAISRRLGIGRSTLYRKLKELGLDDEAA